MPTLQEGAQAAVTRGAEAVLILPTDLPTLSVRDVEAIVHLKQSSPFMAIAPDRKGHGTNALLLSPPDLIGFSFGENSFKIHKEAGLKHGIDPTCVLRDGLSFDVDTPDDHRDLLDIMRTSKV